jgi:hypothetical protein
LEPVRYVSNLFQSWCTLSHIAIIRYLVIVTLHFGIVILEREVVVDGLLYVGALKDVTHGIQGLLKHVPDLLVEK